MIARFGTIAAYLCVFFTLTTRQVVAQQTSPDTSKAIEDRIADMLVQGSPWTGDSRWMADGAWSANLELVFYREEDRQLRAELRLSAGRATIYGDRPDGTVRHLEVKGDRISFTSQSGTRHSALLTDDTLKGETIPPWSLKPVIKYTLRPKQ